MCFVRFSQKTATVSPYNISLMVFVRETVFCEVRTEYLNIINLNFSFQAMTTAKTTNENYYILILNLPQQYIKVLFIFYISYKLSVTDIFLFLKCNSFNNYCYTCHVIQSMSKAKTRMLGKSYGISSIFSLPGCWLEFSWHPESPTCGQLDTSLLGFPLSLSKC
jgi:hypothetical protein